MTSNEDIIYWANAMGRHDAVSQLPYGEASRTTTERQDIAAMVISIEKFSFFPFVLTVDTK
ncbi:hypothetical protein N7478_010642 [Penicillium angulare]|uniref:uncharacterized protein n=1 Tax=Penicillium angulare TaxID=116970 RepID=UPI0025405826|nr:uncharacterized protein N7478_010642 [Penicillium angulare]KAJ5267834.1 hypothetical protein N7478_010642 [Penicillium angulare]